MDKNEALKTVKKGITDISSLEAVSALINENVAIPKIKPFNFAFIFSQLQKVDNLRKLQLANALDMITPTYIRVYCDSKKEKGIEIYTARWELLPKPALWLFDEEHHIKTYSKLEHGMEYMPDNGAWRPLMKNEKNNLLSSFLRENLDRWKLPISLRASKQELGFQNDTMSFFKNGFTFEREVDLPKEMAKRAHLVAFKNGTYNFKTGKIQEHSPANMIINAHDYNIEQDNTPETDYLLTEMIGEKNILLLKQYIGYMFYRENPLQKVLFFYGPGGEGKSTLLNYIEEYIIGRDNVSHITPYDLDGNDKFAAYSMRYKELNTFAELPQDNLNSRTIASIKSLTGNDEMSIQNKGEARINERLYAKHIWSANRLPGISTKEINNALLDRFTVIKFINGNTRPGGENASFWDRHNMKKVKAERNAFVYSCLEAFRKMYFVDHTEFSISDEVKKYTSEWLNDNNTVKYFVDECCNQETLGNKKAVATYKELYSSYKKYCIDALGSQPLNLKNFKSELKRLGDSYEYRGKCKGWYYSENAIDPETGKRKRALIGIELQTPPNLNFVKTL